MSENKSEAQVMRETMERYFVPEVLKFSGIGADTPAVLAVLQGMELKGIKTYLDQFRMRPERRSGTARFTDLSSFLAHANRFKGENSVLYANDDAKSPSLTCVFDYHEAGSNEFEGTHFGQHRGVYPFPLSETWQAWSKAEDGGPMGMSEFAEFLEDRIGDVIEPLGAPIEGEPEADQRLRAQIQRLGCTLASPSLLLDLSRNFRVNENSRTKVAQTLSSGEVSLKFENEHTDENGAPLRVPNMFLIQTPVFHGGALYRVPVRLRYRASSGQVRWIVERLHPELIFEDAIKEALDRATGETGLPVYRGAPEA